MAFDPSPRVLEDDVVSSFSFLLLFENKLSSLISPPSLPHCLTARIEGVVAGEEVEADRGGSGQCVWHVHVIV